MGVFVSSSLSLFFATLLHCSGGDGNAAADDDDDDVVVAACCLFLTMKQQSRYYSKQTQRVHSRRGGIVSINQRKVGFIGFVRVFVPWMPGALTQDREKLK
jgi:hypothetical protein